MQVGLQFRRISRLLSHTARHKSLHAAPLFLLRARRLNNPRAFCQAAVDSLKAFFPSASAEQLNVRACYLLGHVVAAVSNVLSGSPGSAPGDASGTAFSNSSPVQSGSPGAGPMNPTFLTDGGSASPGQVAPSQTTLQNNLDSLNDLSAPASANLQLLTSNRSTLLQALSNIEKTLENVGTANVQNLKS
jgi:hypothetical protein